MAAAIATLKRVFEFKDELLPDPDPSLTEAQVLDLYSARYPELATASIEERIEEDGALVHKIKYMVGSKA